MRCSVSSTHFHVYQRKLLDTKWGPYTSGKQLRQGWCLCIPYTCWLLLFWISILAQYRSSWGHLGAFRISTDRIRTAIGWVAYLRDWDDFSLDLPDFVLSFHVVPELWLCEYLILSEYTHSVQSRARNLIRW
jgi:hypothetical protein